MKQFKLFLLTEYEQEEQYLRNMHKKGYRLVKVSMPGIYEFESCDPKDVVYRLDFNPTKDKSSYVQMFEDYGWTYLQDMNSYSYFYKEASETNENENEIFCDNESRLDMLKKIVYAKLLPVFVVFLCCVLPQLPNLYFSSLSPFILFFLIFFIGITVLYVYLIIRITIGYCKLKEKYEISND